MQAQALSRDTLMPRDPGGNRRGIGLSLLVHAGLLVAIAFGVSWRSHTPEAQQAELWAAVPQAAAARAVEPEAPVAPQPAPPPVPRVDPPPPAPAPAPPPAPAPAPAPLPDAQIAIEKARAEKLRKEREVAEAEREAQRKKAAADKLAADKLAAEKAAAEKQRKLAADKQAQQQTEKKKELEAQQQQAAEERLAQQREADRKKNIERMLGQAGASGDAGATGSAQQSAGPSASYAGRIKARVRPNIVFADEVAGNPTAEVEVRAAADGTILGRKLVRSSGVAAYDNAVLRAIDKTEILPRDVDGRVPSTLLLVFRVRD